MDCRPERIDQFDQLPDELLILILNRVHDARSLTRCLAVSKRVGLVVPLVDNVFLPIPRKSAPPSPKPSRWFPLNVLAKTVKFLRRVVMPKLDVDCCDDESYHDPDVILKPFRAVRSLNVDIPSCGREIGLKNGDGFLLRWVADFGASLNSCTILGADSLYGKQGNDAVSEAKAKTAAEPILTEKDLKQRIVWILSCLIAAASRHALMKDLIGKNPNIENVQMTDSGKHGKLWMGKEHVAEVRSSAAENSESELKLMERSVVSNLKMKLWYVPEMELPETGYVMKGTTLIAIRPAKGKDDCLVDDGEGFFGDWFGEDDNGGSDDRGKAFGEAVREMRKMKVKRSFTMEMNYF